MSKFKVGDIVRLKQNSSTSSLTSDKTYRVARIETSVSQSYLHLDATEGGWFEDRFEFAMEEQALEQLIDAIRNARAAGLVIKASYETTISKEL